MREILFKAKLKGRNQWIEGFYCSMRETTYCFAEDYERHSVPLHHLIAVDEMTDWGLPNQLRLYEIDPETLCEYTGLTDKNGKKIWENDICDRKEKYSEVVKMNEGDWSLDYSYMFGKEYGDSFCNLGFYVTERKCVEVIGNIFDNPELLVQEGNRHAEGKWTKASDERTAAGIAVSQRWSSNETHSGISAVADGAPAVSGKRRKR